MITHIRNTILPETIVSFYLSKRQTTELGCSCFPVAGKHFIYNQDDIVQMTFSSISYGARGWSICLFVCLIRIFLQYLNSSGIYTEPLKKHFALNCSTYYMRSLHRHQLNWIKSLSQRILVFYLCCTKLGY